MYHVINRGERREPIFEGDADRQRFVEQVLEDRRGAEEGEEFKPIRRG